MNITNIAYQKAQEVISACAKPTGFYASGLPGGYEATWSRDSNMTAIGATLLGDKFKTTYRKSLILLAKNQGEMGQIPNCVGSYNNDRQSDVTFNSIDSSLWFIIGNYIYARRFKDESLLKKLQSNIYRAYWWLRAQDPDNVGLIAQQPTNDWQDAFPHKYGYTIHCNALFYLALNLMGDNQRAQEAKKIINGEKRPYCSLWNKKLGYYYPWAWKNHDHVREHEEWFDTAGNLLAIITGLATSKIANGILNYIEKQKINRPFPCKTIWPPIKKGDKEWRDYFELCDAREPLHYLNAGIWPFIGGLYVGALVKMKQYKKAEEELKNLARANMKIVKNPSSPPYIIPTNGKRDVGVSPRKISGQELIKLRQKEFNEWLDVRTGEAKGEPYQGWSAGTYIWAYECVKRKRVLFL